ncbi:DUF6691 family protein [Thalassobium sp. R2A62]|jgi:uncharacterized membrane protein YedE/YeeE|uniref:DUF6691 family protein n=1 Tax=Thalassobium sp. R2A62 TaxID=633131 RepID=UPI0001B1D60D|nr:DUF6691 family protein [Thalassobium sp. R2A62]EET49223.1 YeeE/YedE family protein [Thalassobium sp. R2A62]
MRNLFAALAGGLLGTGLLISEMTDTRKVQGWLDIFGDWDPTLAFVMGGAIVPMAIAWQLTRARAPIVGGAFPVPTDAEITPKLTIGSIFFGMGWGLTGLCPGPAMASLGFGGTGGLIFLAAMLAGMIAAPKLAIRLDPATA